MSGEMADEAPEKAANTASNYITEKNAINVNNTDGNDADEEDTAGPQHKIRTRDVFVFTIGALILYMLFVVLGYLIGELVLFLEKNGDISGFFKAA